MRVNDLLILGFSPSDQPQNAESNEVTNCCTELFVKHTGLLGTTKPAGKSFERTEGQTTLHCRVKRAWSLLMTSHDQSLITAAEYAPDRHYRVDKFTDAFPPSPFDQDLGVYIVCHTNSGHPKILGYNGSFETFAKLGDQPFLPSAEQAQKIAELKRTYQNTALREYYEKLKVTQGTPGEHYEFLASSIVTMFKRLGISQIRKLCFLACQAGNYRSGLLEELALKLHEANFKTLVAGWDINITVTKKNDGFHKVQQVSGGDPTDIDDNLRKQHKFVYVVNVAETVRLSNPLPFPPSKVKQEDMTTAVAKQQEKYLSQNKNVSLSKPTGVVGSAHEKKKDKTVVSYRRQDVLRVSYSEKGWSDKT